MKGVSILVQLAGFTEYMKYSYTAHLVFNGEDDDTFLKLQFALLDGVGSSKRYGK